MLPGYRVCSAPRLQNRMDPRLEKKAVGNEGDLDRIRKTRKNRNLPKRDVRVEVQDQFRRRAQNPTAPRPILATTGAEILAKYRALVQMLQACLEPRYGFSRATTHLATSFWMAAFRHPNSPSGVPAAIRRNIVA